MRKIREELYAATKELEKRRRRRRLWTYYPDSGPLRRELYVPHMKFFEAGGSVSTRAILAANRIGKSEGIGAYEVALHATGLYPDWWRGRRFKHPPVIWVAGKTNIKTRDVNQKKLLGEMGELGTGMIPGDMIVKGSERSKQGTPNALEQIYVKHDPSGGKCPIIFKSYAEGRRSFEGEEVGVIWLDEECEIDILGECQIRIMSTNPMVETGMILCTFTPLEGMSDTVMYFLPDGRLPGRDGLYFGDRFVINATWDDAPHLTKAEREKLWAELPPYQRDARSRGVPQLGSGAIYPIAEDDVVCEDFEIPVHWPRVYGFDYGWNWTAAAWLAVDKESDVVYVYNTYKRGKSEPVIHADAVRARGGWIPGVSDPSGGTSQRDGRKLLSEYQDLLGNLFPADNGVEAGLFAVWKRLSSGRLKVFRSCRQWFEEFRLYRRDEHGKVVKQNDHLMDATRYAIMSGLDIAAEMPEDDDIEWSLPAYMVCGGGAGRNAVTGY